MAGISYPLAKPRSMVEEILTAAMRDWRFNRTVAVWERLPRRPPRSVTLPAAVHDRLKTALAAEGISALYTHQAHAWRVAAGGSGFVVATPTASGKSLCYHLPVLDALLRDPAATALYLYPAKALARDQEAFLRRLTAGILPAEAIGSFDGDTPPEMRRGLRATARLILTNPDMLHRGILPHHSLWSRFLAGLRFVVLDEIHVYCGLIGSHAANVLRRLLRLAAARGAAPLFLCGSATIANPAELAHALTGRKAVLIDDDGSPRGEKHLVVCNPFSRSSATGGNRMAHLAASRRWAEAFLSKGVRTIVFARSRLDVERLMRDLRQTAAVEGYRSDYLPETRRAREAALRRGALSGVVATSALELGIDIGSLDAAVLAGYPGSLAAMWQRAGRVGRRDGPSAVILVAGPGPLDQYLAGHPELLLHGPAEQALLDPDNPFVLAAHLECAAAEMPLAAGEVEYQSRAAAVVDALARAGRIRMTPQGWAAVRPSPAQDVSIRGSAGRRIAVWDCAESRCLGYVEREAAGFLLHEGARYLHDGHGYIVEKLDLDAGRAIVRPAEEGVETASRTALRVELAAGFCGNPGGASYEWGWDRAAVMADRGTYVRRDGATGVVTGWGRAAGGQSADDGRSVLQTIACWQAWPAHWSRLPPHLLGGAARGLARLLPCIAARLILCSQHNLLAVWQAPSPSTGRLTLFLCDACPGGAGLAQHIAAVNARLLAEAERAVSSCPCPSGCPACIGPAAPQVKETVRRLLRAARR